MFNKAVEKGYILSTTFNGQDTRVQNFSVETVRNLLRLDNKGIAKLCAQVSLMPKKDRHGRTYFSRDDIEILRKVRNLHNRTQTVQSRVSNPIEVKHAPSLVTAPPKPSVQKVSAGVEKIVKKLDNLEDSISEKISKVIEEKLEGMDEVVVELVRCKTENETLRYKLNELNKENYNLKNELNSYKSLGMGFYVKKSGSSIL